MEKHFLKKDLKQAYKEKSCALELSIQSQNLLMKNDFYAVEEKLVDMLKSVHELKRLQGNKNTQDQLHGVLNHLNQLGMDHMIVRRLQNENR